MRDDLIQMFRGINNIDKISWHREPERVGITPRGHDQVQPFTPKAKFLYKLGRRSMESTKLS